MAFSFGATPAPSTFGAPAAAPTGGGLFGAPSPAAPSTAGLFGSSAPSGGLFGSTTAPAPSMFGSAPSNAPAPSGGLFGSAPAPSGGLFGSAPAPSGGLFGNNPAPAPSGGGLFGSSAPAPSFGAPAAAAQQQYQQQQQYTAPLSGNTPYSQLPPNIKNAIDDIYRQMMSHRRTLASVKTMAPSLLEESVTTADNTNNELQQQQQPTAADIAAGSPRKKSKNTSNLTQQLLELRHEIDQIAKRSVENIDSSSKLKASSGETVAMTKLHGLWPVETIAARRQVILSSLRRRVDDAGASSSSSFNNNTSTTNNNNNNNNDGNKSLNLSSMPEMDVLALQHILDIRAASVDRKEQIPSPYYWEMLRDLEHRAQNVYTGMEGVTSRLLSNVDDDTTGGAVGIGECEPLVVLCEDKKGHNTSFPARCAKLARIQNDQFLNITNGAARIHEEVELLKSRHKRLMETRRGIGQYDDPFSRADVEEMRKERELQQRVIEERLMANASTAPSAPSTPAPAPPSGGLFGSNPAPASGGLFGTPAAAPSTGGLFGSTPAPGGLFGTPAAAPSTGAPAGGLFGSTPAGAPAPATGSLFGSTPAGAPAPATGGLFGATPAPAAPAPSGGLFGAPAPAAPAPSGGLFGSTPAAPAGGLFAAPTTPASTLAPRKKPGSRSGGRRR